MTDKALTLMSHFSGQTLSDWEALVSAGLKGKDFETLVSKTDDDLIRGPLSSEKNRPSNLSPLSRTQAPLLEGRPWHMCSPVRDPNLSFANEQLLADLTGGASAADVTVGDDALSFRDRADFKRLFEGVHLNLIPMRFDIRGDIYEVVALILDGKALTATPVNLGLDPIGLSLNGTPTPTNRLEDILKGLLDNITAISINAALVHDAGGTEAQELSVMAASAAAYWRQFGAKTKLSVRLASDQDGHLGIAKFRAARRIMTRIADAFGADTNIEIHGVTSLRMMQTTDPWTNMLRIMSAGFGAICGGADYVTLRPFTDALSKGPRLATPFGYRIARNMQLMMMEESHLGQVNDVAHGSYFHERMTEQLAQTAWTEFQAIEAGGGIEALIETGVLAQSIQAAKTERDKKNAPILGVTLHPADNIRPAKLREA